MSIVTNVVLAIGCGDDEFDGHVPAGLQFLRGYLERHEIAWPQSVDKVSGGTKHLECGLYAFAFNYLDVKLPNFIKVIAEAPWEQPERVQLFIKEQDDDTFKLQTLGADRKWMSYAPQTAAETTAPIKTANPSRDQSSFS